MTWFWRCEGEDFKQIMEIGEEQLPQGKIVISAKSRPTGEHARRYNEQLNLQEVSILTSSERHDLVLEMQGGGIQRGCLSTSHFCSLMVLSDGIQTLHTRKEKAGLQQENSMHTI